MDDLISRQAVIEKFEPWLKVVGYSEGELNMLKAVLYELRFLPSAQAEERTNKHTETHACDCISRKDPVEREAVVDILHDAMQNRSESEENLIGEIVCKVDLLPSAKPEPHEIGYSECANSTLKMWIDNVLTDGEYSHIMDKLNAYWAERREDA